MIFGFGKKEDKPFLSALVLAAGSGSRMNTDLKKQYMDVFGAPVISYSLQTLNQCEAVCEIILVVSQEDIILAQDIVKAFEIDKVTKIVVGGETRQDSVFCGLSEVNEESEYILVHDGARPFVQEEDIHNVISDGISFGAAALGVKSKDTMKMVDDKNFAINTLDRKFLYQIQTPQVIKKDLLLKGYEHANKNHLSFTDDTSLVEAMGIKVKITDGRYDNFKITTQEDFMFAEFIAERRN